MSDATVVWDLPDEPGGNVQHCAEHDVTREEVEEVLADPDNETYPDKGGGGRSVTYGETADGRHLAVVWETAIEDPLTIYPITAFAVLRRRRRRHKRK